MVKFVGFISEHDNTEHSLPLLKLNNSNSRNKYLDNCIKINEYLDSGSIVFCWQGYFKDLISGELISSYCYQTDGKFIWPSYYKHYLNKHNIAIDDELYEHILDNKPIFVDIDFDLIEKYLFNELKI